MKVDFCVELAVHRRAFVRFSLPIHEYKAGSLTVLRSPKLLSFMHFRRI